MNSTGVDSLRTAGELLRAARQQQQQQNPSTDKSGAPVQPWLLPILFVPGLGGTRLELRQATHWSPRESHHNELWDPDDPDVNADLFGWLHDQVDDPIRARWTLEFAQRWQQPAAVRRGHASPMRVTLMTQLLGINSESTLLPALQERLLLNYRAMQERGWMALCQAYWPLAERLAPSGDPQLTLSAHAHGWDWRGTVTHAAPSLAQHISTLLSQSEAHAEVQGWRWPARPALVIVAENSGIDLARAASRLLPEDSILAIYAVDDAQRNTSAGSVDWYAALCNVRQVAAPPSSLLSFGWRQWQRSLQHWRGARLAVNAVLPGALGLLPTAKSSRWLAADTPASVMADPFRMLRSSIRWDEQALQPTPLHALHVDEPPNDADWTKAALQAGTDAAAAAKLIFSAPTRVPLIDCRFAALSTSLSLSMRRVSRPDLPETHTAWQFDTVAPASPDTPDTPDRSDTSEPLHASDINSKLTSHSMNSLCSAIFRDVTQRMLRAPPTPFGQAFTEVGRKMLVDDAAPDSNAVPITQTSKEDR